MATLPRSRVHRPTTNAFFRGEEGARRTDEELALAKQRAEERKNSTKAPYRFYVPAGESRQAVICDDKPDFYMYEHALRDSEGRWGRLFCGCVKMFDVCAACEAIKESYYGMFMTVIDFTPFETKSGEVVEFSRKLLVVKPAQQKKFLRMYQKEGTLRGALIEFTRDGDKDASIGNDFEILEFLPEEEMQSYVREWTDQQGNKHVEYCDEPYVYEEIFEQPNADKIRALVGGAPTPGSREHERSTSARPTRGGTPAPRRPSPSTAKRHAAPDADDWEEPDTDLPFEPDEPKKASSGRATDRRASIPAPRRGAQPRQAEEAPIPRRRAVPPPVEEEEGEPVTPSRIGRRLMRGASEEAPPSASAARAARRAR